MDVNYQSEPLLFMNCPSRKRTACLFRPTTEEIEAPIRPTKVLSETSALDAVDCPWTAPATDIVFCQERGCS